MEVRRGDIFMANLTSHNVDYACGVRPVLIVQNDKGNAHSDSYIAAVITSKPKKYLPTHFKLDSKCGLRKNSTVLCEHLITVKRFMLIDYIGTIVNTEDEKRMNKALSVSLQLEASKKRKEKKA